MLSKVAVRIACSLHERRVTHCSVCSLEQKSQPPTAPFRLGTEGITMNDLWLEYVIPASQNMWIAELTTKPHGP